MSDEILEKKDKFKLILSKIKENSKLVLSIILIAIFAFVLIFFLDKRRENKNILISEDFNRAKILIQNDKTEESLVILKNIINKKHKFYSPLSLYLIIDFELEKNYESVAEMFDKVISIKKIDKENINLIKIKKTLFLSNHYDEQEMLKILNPIINSNSIWRSNAIQILIDYFLNNGDSLKSDQYRKLLKKQNAN
tara:strand:- start:3009 stop:3593 length:585 start_codon:yes stop_codon:yes gene_type:complete